MTKKYSKAQRMIYNSSYMFETENLEIIFFVINTQLYMDTSDVYTEKNTL